jgi:hypothetical protein
MDAQLKAKWIQALRSGEFRQAEGMLHNSANDSYCCLGVLCKVMGAEFGQVGEIYGPNYDHVPHIDGKLLSSGYDEELDSEVAQQVGIPDQSELVMRNDGNTKLGVPQHSFAEIADYIEKNL